MLALHWRRAGDPAGLRAAIEGAMSKFDMPGHHPMHEAPGSVAARCRAGIEGGAARCRAGIEGGAAHSARASADAPRDAPVLPSVAPRALIQARGDSPIRPARLTFAAR
jgi:hypothetical protein